MSRAVLILAAHGSRREPGVRHHLQGLAAKLARRAAFDSVVAAFHQGGPGLDAVLDSIEADRAVVVPVMTSDGWFCREILPKRLAANRRFEGVDLHITPPLGAHPAVAGVVAARVRELAAAFSLDLDRATVAVIGHGTTRHPRSRHTTFDLVARLRQRGAGAEVVAAFLDDEPSAGDVVARSAHDAVIAVPFFISGGPHAARDVPAALGLGADPPADLPHIGCVNRRTVVVDRAVGLDDRLAEILAAMAREGLAGLRQRGRSSSKRLRLGTRRSALALWQANHVARLLHEIGVHVDLVPIATSGDRDLATAIDDLDSDAPFTDDIDAALRAGRIDLAVHALKDLPTIPPPDLTLAAILCRGDPTESLVSAGRGRLDDLPAGSVIGTSSPRRAAQLRRLRPDLVPRPIRGAVDDRVRQVRDGRFAAAILATAGLQRLGLEHEITQTFRFDEFLPAPGQAALVVQTRADDVDTIGRVSPLDHARTRRAVLAELALLRAFDGDRDACVAAHATVGGDRIELRARRLDRRGTVCEDANVLGREPDEAAARAIALLRRVAAVAPGAAP